ncbi:hypothetical protein LA080_014676 [Diaporthe eres]|nr:hypothetical protein LA080_014676 [Diaporthe eres]
MTKRPESSAASGGRAYWGMAGYVSTGGQPVACLVVASGEPLASGAPEDVFEGGPASHGPGPRLGGGAQSAPEAGGSRVFDLQAETAQGGRESRLPPPDAARLGAGSVR